MKSLSTNSYWEVYKKTLSSFDTFMNSAPPLESCLHALNAHYPQGFVIYHFSSTISGSMNKFIIVHPGELHAVSEPMLVILYFGHDETCAYAVLSCFDDGQTIRIVKAQGTQEMEDDQPNRYYYGNHIMNSADTDDTEDNYFHQEMRKTLGKLFPYRSLVADCSPLTPKINRKQFWKIIEWVSYNNFLPYVKAKYRTAFSSIDSVESYDPANPWLVSYTERLERKKVEADKQWKYEMHKLRHGRKAVATIGAWWRRRLVLVRMKQIIRALHMMKEHNCHSKLLKMNVASFIVKC